MSSDSKVAAVRSVVLDGVRGVPVDVECSIGSGLPAITVVGLPDASVNESRDRMRSALENSGYAWKPRRTTYNLSPAHVRKHGTGFDLAMAIALLCVDGVIEPERLTGTVCYAELGLDGTLREVAGVLPALIAAAGCDTRRIILPTANRAEAAIRVAGADLEVLCAPTLKDVVAHLNGDDSQIERIRPRTPQPPADLPDLAEVKGQPLGKRALEIAAAGGHHLLMGGPPGTGKTMLARRLPGILPALDEQAQLEVTSIHSVCGALDPSRPLIVRPPFEAPHHGVTAVAMVGGGSSTIRPGAASRAHRGVLFLDEAPEFARALLDQLRQPIESGTVTVQRARGSVTFPARFQLVLAANPCPCASTGPNAVCVCSSIVRRRYLSRLSGPLLDRIDLSVELLPPARAALLDPTTAEEPSARVAERVRLARERASARWGNGLLNSDVASSQLIDNWQPDDMSRTLLARAYDSGAISGRGLDRARRVAWTLADLAGKPSPGSDEIAEALGFRTRGFGRAA